jgi:hypothetical protein
VKATAEKETDILQKFIVLLLKVSELQGHHIEHMFHKETLHHFHSVRRYDSIHV